MLSSSILLLQVVEVPVILREERLVEVPKVQAVPVAGSLKSMLHMQSTRISAACKVTQHLRPAVEAGQQPLRPP